MSNPGELTCVDETHLGRSVTTYVSTLNTQDLSAPRPHHILRQNHSPAGLFPLLTPPNVGTPGSFPLPTYLFQQPQSPKMKFRRPPHRPLRPSLLRLDIVIRCPDQAKTFALDLDPENTTIATVQTLVADEIKAEWRTLGFRVLRDILPAARVIFKCDGRELGMEETLIGCAIEDGAEIEATVIRTEKDGEPMQARTRKGEEMEKRKRVRKMAAKSQKK